MPKYIVSCIINVRRRSNSSSYICTSGTEGNYWWHWLYEVSSPCYIIHLLYILYAWLYSYAHTRLLRYPRKQGWNFTWNVHDVNVIHSQFERVYKICDSVRGVSYAHAGCLYLFVACLYCFFAVISKFSLLCLPSSMFLCRSHFCSFHMCSGQHLIVLECHIC